MSEQSAEKDVYPRLIDGRAGCLPGEVTVRVLPNVVRVPRIVMTVLATADRLERGHRAVLVVRECLAGMAFPEAGGQGQQAHGYSRVGRLRYRAEWGRESAAVADLIAKGVDQFQASLVIYGATPAWDAPLPVWRVWVAQQVADLFAPLARRWSA